MKILCIIDHFGSGGAQRQMVNLAVGLKKHGHDVEMFIYYPELNFFRREVEDAEIPVHQFDLKKGGFSFQLLKKLRQVLKKGNFDSAISFLETPNIYLELASLGLDHKVVVSERNSYLKETSALKSWLIRQLHRFADVVVANSWTQGEWLKKSFPFLNSKALTIYNGYDVKSFGPRAAPKMSKDSLRLVGVGRVSYQKNIKGLIEGLVEYEKKSGPLPEVLWAGREDDEGSLRELKELLSLHPKLEAKWSWLGERDDILELISSSHALVLPSFFEGLPNVVCEAFMVGRPVLVSDVCDHPQLVGQMERGMLFDPKSSKQISESIQQISQLPQEQYNSLSQSARNYAEKFLSIDVFIKNYEEILKPSKKTL